MNLFQRYLAEEFAEDFQEGRISRREALRLITGVTGSLAAANALLAACAPITSPNQSIATPLAHEPAAGEAPVPSVSSATSTVSAGDPAISASSVQFPGEDGASLTGYLAYAADGQARPVILVCHENRGLTAHIEDVTRRLAKAGYAALAVDLLSRQGGTAQFDSSDVPGQLGNIEPDQFVRDFRSGWRYLGEQSFARAERVGMVGFCFGGGVTWRMATKMPELLAAVPFYGPHPPLEDVPGIRAAVLGIYAENDARINQGILAIEAAMREHQKTFEKVIYPGVDHAFHNDTGTRYNASAAQDAWARTLEWFRRYVDES